MRATSLLLLAGVALAPAALADDDDKAKKIAEQKAALEANWKLLDLGELAVEETSLFLIAAPKPMSGKLKSIADLLSRYHAAASKALALDAKSAPQGKITVYLLPDVASVGSFARRVEKRRPETGEAGSYMAADDKLHVAAGPTRGGTPADVRAGEMTTALLLARKVGVRTPMPGWLVEGLGRATTHRVLAKDKSVLADKKKIRALAKKKSAQDAWSDEAGSEDGPLLAASVVEYLAYEGGAARFPKFVEGFKPIEKRDNPTPAQALEVAGISADKLNKAWKAWASK
jgi:hypothetical protein